MRAPGRVCVALLVLIVLSPGAAAAQPLAVLAVPFISQSEALCGGAAAAMVLRFWGATGLTAESFAPLLNRSATGIATDVLAADVRRRGFQATAVKGDDTFAREQLDRGRPLIALIEDRPGAFHYVVVVAWHERGVIVHDPARAPFQVIAPTEFARRWSRGDRWMLVITPGAEGGPESIRDRAAGDVTTSDVSEETCERLVEQGIRRAQASDLSAAEQSLTRALGCPGGAAARELAAVRLLQRRWPEVELLARDAIAADPNDRYAWQLLGTALFISDQSLPALAAWNRADEPRVDLVRVNGLRRTRQRVVERLIGVPTGRLLTTSAWLRAGRQLAELPASSRTSLTYVPAANGLVQLSAAVVEPAVVPRDVPDWAAIAANGAINREVDAGLSSLTGGGERLTISYRFWPDRPRYAVELRAPAPFGGVWGATAAYEQQSFTTDAFGRVRHRTAELTWGNWTSATLRTQVSVGVDRWNDADPLAAAGARVDYVSPERRGVGHAESHVRVGTASFATWESAATVMTSAEHRGFVAVVGAAAVAVSSATPPDLWPAGDVGQVRGTLLRAHPLLDEGRLRSERLGRTILSSSAEIQRWRSVRPFAMAAAAFVDVARTGRREHAAAVTDVDVGIGLRLTSSLMPGLIRLDVGTGLRDGRTALSIVYAR